MSQAQELDSSSHSNEHAQVFTREHAESLDKLDPLQYLRAQYYIPSKGNRRSKTLSASGEPSNSTHDSSVYLCGNSLGLQPRKTSERIQQYLSTWATQGVFGHFKPLAASPLPIWLDVDEEAAKRLAPVVGAKPSEIAVMQTLTANLHFLMSAFYRPDTQGRHKIILEGKAFPSDHYAVESQIRHHGLNPSDSMVLIEPSSPSSPIITTSHILSIIDSHASTTAILLLPGIQFYTGQLLDIKTITAHARSKGIFVIWDMAHAAGNVPLSLHDWEVDAAVFCTYKYLNAGPGSIGALFVHERHSEHPPPHRLSGWWGNVKSKRFAMTNEYEPSPGAAGFQLSNPSVFDITSLCASLEMFELAGGIEKLRAKSVKLTAYLELLLQNLKEEKGIRQFDIITPTDPSSRGAQLSLKLEDGLLEVVMEELENRSVVVDERKPDVIRVAPAPLYNSFMDVYLFVEAFGEALLASQKAKDKGQGGGGKGTDELLQTT